VGARQTHRKRRRLLPALSREPRDDLWIEISRLARRIAGQQVVARDRPRHSTLLLLERRRHGQLAPGALKVLVREELRPDRELREEDRERQEDPEHPAPAELEPVPAAKVRDVRDHVRYLPLVGSVPVISSKTSSIYP